MSDEQKRVVDLLISQNWVDSGSGKELKMHRKMGEFEFMNVLIYPNGYVRLEASKGSATFQIKSVVTVCNEDVLAELGQLFNLL